MGTIVTRKRKDGSSAYTAQILIKKNGQIVHREAKTFSRKPAARAWLNLREAELARPGGLDKPDDPPLREVIDRYITESRRELGRTKTQVLRTIQKLPLAEKRCGQIGSADYLTLAQSLPGLPQTVQNYMSHLGAIVRVARPAWGYPLNQQAFNDAVVVARKLGVTSKSASRDRRPTLDELDKLMQHFGTISERRPLSAPMQKIIGFALFSTRRQDEITRITYEDLDHAHSRIMVRDMKHPGDKAGNDTLCDLTPEAMAIIKAMPTKKGRIFPYSTDAISAAFTRACKVLGIEDLHFHDLRHEGVSRLFEMGWTIPQAANVSGHRSWSSLKRYSHIRTAGDKYAGWKWLSVVTDAQ